jgi:hypothetical protein
MNLPRRNRLNHRYRKVDLTDAFICSHAVLNPDTREME